MISKTFITIIIFISTFFNVFAADSDSWSNLSVDIPETTSNNWSWETLVENEPLESNSLVWSWEEEQTSSDANVTKSLATFKWKIWEYAEVDCNKDFYMQNVCDQCFDWWKIAVWEKITNLFDSWTNLNSSEQVVYKEEQIFPEFINLWWNNTKWIINPNDSNKFWKFANDIIWTKWESNKEEFILDWNKTINFLESEFWSSYSMESTDKADNDPIWLLKISAAYHDIDTQWIESNKKVITECVAYYNNYSAPTPTAPVENVIKQAVEVKTWPEIYALVLLALILWFVFVRFRKKI